MSNSPAALRSMWGSFGTLCAGVLGAKLGEQIAVAIANLNRCEYCLAAHRGIGRDGLMVLGGSGRILRPANKDPSGEPMFDHVKFGISDFAASEAFFVKALKPLGITVGAEGAPGLRPQYNANYYAAFVIGPDGHNIEAVCHDAGA